MQPRPMFEKIIEATCKYYDISEAELFAKDRERETVYRRKLLISISRQQTNLSYKKIANRIGLKDPRWLSEVVNEIELGQVIYPQIAHDIKNVMFIVTNLQ